MFEIYPRRCSQPSHKMQESLQNREKVYDFTRRYPIVNRHLNSIMSESFEKPVCSGKCDQKQTSAVAWNLEKCDILNHPFYEFSAMSYHCFVILSGSARELIVLYTLVPASTWQIVCRQHSTNNCTTKTKSIMKD